MVGLKRKKKRAGNICKGTLGIECERDRPVGLGATLGDRLKIKIFFLVSGIFRGKLIVSYCWALNVL